MPLKKPSFESQQRSLDVPSRHGRSAYVRAAKVEATNARGNSDRYVPQKIVVMDMQDKIQSKETTVLVCFPMVNGSLDLYRQQVKQQRTYRTVETC